MTHSRPRPVVLCILDGWGHRESPENNAIILGKTPVYDQLWQAWPHALLQTSASDVGLPDGQMGNSEVGHQNLGAGRIVLQDLPRIDQAVAEGTLADFPTLLDFIQALKTSGGRCHLMGLLSPGGVHSHMSHIAAMAKIVAGAGIEVCVHAFLDGRDTAPKNGEQFLSTFEAEIADDPRIRVASLCGRYYAMDRDKRWDRVSRAYDLIVNGTGRTFQCAGDAIAAAYDNDVTDEFVLPANIADYDGMADGDGLVCANFRADRARQLLTALVDPAFDGFDRGTIIAFAARLGMVSYSDALDEYLATLFAPLALQGTLPEVIAEAGLKQLRIAETEKYAHVTFFLNGGSETTYEGEERILIPSPKVATYDLQPEMAAPEVTDELVAAIASGRFDFVVVNFANPDMVGHTGNLNAAIAAVEAVDSCLGRLTEAIKNAGGTMLITADHGNVETMTDPTTSTRHTAHTTNPVPVLLVNGPPGRGLANGRLADVAPTLLEILELPIPEAMTGTSLLAAMPVEAVTEQQQHLA